MRILPKCFRSGDENLRWKCKRCGYSLSWAKESSFVWSTGFGVLTFNKVVFGVGCDDSVFAVCLITDFYSYLSLSAPPPPIFGTYNSIWITKFSKWEKKVDDTRVKSLYSAAGWRETSSAVRASPQQVCHRQNSCITTDENIFLLG